MKKRINIIFFSICFLAALMAEAYCFLVLDGDLISVIGIGLVVLIVGYLLLDSIRGEWKHSSQKVLFYLEQLYCNEKEKWDERYTEILNLHKASYTATKKNSLMINDRFEELQKKLSTMEKSNTLALQRISELQRKIMEGQKNALNIEVNYNKENTKLLVKTLREECSKLNQDDQISLIVSLLQHNQELLMEKSGDQRRGAVYAEEDALEFDTDFMELNQDEVDPYSEKEEVDDEIELGYEETEESNNEIEQPVEQGLESEVEMDQVNQEIKPLYEDPNKALTTDEIASLFASYGK